MGSFRNAGDSNIRVALRDEVTHADALTTAQRAADRIVTLLDEEFKLGLSGLVEREGE